MPSRDFGHDDDTSAPQSGGSGGNRSLVLKLAGLRICGAPRVMVRRAAVLRGSHLRMTALASKDAPRPGTSKRSDQRLENWNERRALARPYFLRSTTRESRVRKPLLLSTGRRSGSQFSSALDMPW